MNDKILIFIPMYCCEKQISRVLKKIAELGDKQNLFSGVLVVDNGSPDNSIEVASEAIKDLSIPSRVVKNKKNYSLGGSHKVAFLYALEHGYTHVIVLHGDDQANIADLVSHIEEGQHLRYDSMLGSRFMKGAITERYSGFRSFGNHVFNIALSILSGHKVLDLGSGLNIYKTSWLKNKFFLPFPNNLTFNVYLLLYSVYDNSNFIFFPISWREEDQVSNAKLFSQSVEILGLALKFAFGRKRLFNKFIGAPIEEYVFECKAMNKEADGLE